MECTIPVPFGANESEMIKEILASSKKNSDCRFVAG